MRDSKSSELTTCEKYLLFLWSVFGAAAFAVILDITFDGFDRLFPLPPPSEESRTYTYEPEVSHNPPVDCCITNNNSTDEKQGSGQGKANFKSDSAGIITSPESNFIKDKRDLNAQEGMWRAANYLVVLTFCQMFIGAATLGFLGWTLITQRGELQEARNTVMSQRAFLLPEYKLFDVMDPTKDRVILAVNICNYGSTPAIDVKVASGFSVSPKNSLPPTVLINRDMLSKVPMSVAPSTPLRRSVDCHLGGIAESLVDKESILYVAFLVEYRDIFKKPHTEYFKLRFSVSSIQQIGKSVFGVLGCGPSDFETGLASEGVTDEIRLEQGKNADTADELSQRAYRVISIKELNRHQQDVA